MMSASPLAVASSALTKNVKSRLDGDDEQVARGAAVKHYQQIEHHNIYNQHIPGLMMRERW